MTLLFLLFLTQMTHPTLHQLIDTPTQRDLFIEDAVGLVNEEMESKSGFFGFTIRNTYKLVRRLDNGKIIHNTISNMLGEFLTTMEPWHQAYLETDPVTRPDFATFLKPDSTEITDALLAIADRRRANVHNRIIGGSYDRFRSYADTHVAEAIPGIARLISKHAH